MPHKSRNRSKPKGQTLSLQQLHATPSAAATASAPVNQWDNGASDRVREAAAFSRAEHIGMSQDERELHRLDRASQGGTRYSADSYADQADSLAAMGDRARQRGQYQADQSASDGYRAHLARHHDHYQPDAGASNFVSQGLNYLNATQRAETRARHQQQQVTRDAGHQQAIGHDRRQARQHLQQM